MRLYYWQHSYPKPNSRRPLIIVMFFRQTNGWVRRLWIVLLVFSLLCSQSVTLHIHNLDHNHTSFETSEHDYVSNGKIHSAYDFSHNEHHDGIVYEVNTHSDGVLKNISNTLSVLAILIFPFALLLFIPLAQMIYRYRESRLVLYERHLLSPPLRAPPGCYIFLRIIVATWR